MKVRLSAQPFSVLAVLLERPGDVVTREDLRQRLWPADTYVAAALRAVELNPAPVT